MRIGLAVAKRCTKPIDTKCDSGLSPKTSISPRRPAIAGDGFRAWRSYASSRSAGGGEGTGELPEAWTGAQKKKSDCGRVGVGMGTPLYMAPRAMVDLVVSTPRIAGSGCGAVRTSQRSPPYTNIQYVCSCFAVCSTGPCSRRRPFEAVPRPLVEFELPLASEKETRRTSAIP